MNRREQFNITASKFSPEVYAFIENLSTTRKLSEWIAAAAEQEIEIRRQGSPTGMTCCCPSKEILAEIQLIKRMIEHREFTPKTEPKGAPSTVIMEQISSDKAAQILPDEDVEYGFL
ncbi:hypothetical protein PghCCS26_46550 [Paenibacillus glycanilyticus]|uniref:Uncharacterized protein n=1 Tax=Paenibacillus glycanilyticus TaxID=126569 RepID=A0ABQ6NR10_9BACL|nr:hypothetical protein [Paenibacillus glycanilyticus]GMK47525.1 hypothetical protein PghCCS26_46550 [Paenibacillus glycanilyticus]